VVDEDLAVAERKRRIDPVVDRPVRFLFGEHGLQLAGKPITGQRDPLFR